MDKINAQLNQNKIKKSLDMRDLANYKNENVLIKEYRKRINQQEDKRNSQVKKLFDKQYQKISLDQLRHSFISQNQTQEMP